MPSRGKIQKKFFQFIKKSGGGLSSPEGYFRRRGA
jgi:hypothetical protein